MAAVVKTSRHTLVFDTGPRFGEHFDVGEAVFVPHHGSATSSTPAFLSTVKPRLALLSRGFGNRFDFPRASVMRRYARRGITVVDTVRLGAVTVTFDRANGMRLLPGYRDRAGLYWNRVPGP